MLQDDPSDYTKSRIKSFFERVQEASSSNNSLASSRAGSSSLPLSSSNSNSSSSPSGVKTLPHQPHHQLHQGNGLSPSSSILPTTSTPSTASSSPISSSKRSNATNKNKSSTKSSKQQPQAVVPMTMMMNQISSSDFNNNNNNGNDDDDVTMSISPAPPTLSSPISSLNNNNKNKHSSSKNKNQQQQQQQQKRSESMVLTSTTTTNSKNQNEELEKNVCLATYPPAPQSKLNNNNNNNSNSESSSYQIFRTGPVPLEVIQRHLSNRKLKYIRQLGDKLYLAQRQTSHSSSGDFICSYVLTMQDMLFGNQLLEQVRTDSRHPGSVVVISAVKHSDGIVEVETEYCDVGPLERLYPYFGAANSSMNSNNNSNQLLLLHPQASAVAAKSITRQILLALHTFHIVHSKVHRGVSPRTVLVRRDGVVKLGIFDAMTKQDFTISSSYPNQFWRSPFCAPECNYYSNYDSSSNTSLDLNEAVENFFKHSDSNKADVWSVGMIILSLMLGGENFFSSSSSSSSSSNWKILEQLGLFSRPSSSSSAKQHNTTNTQEEEQIPPTLLTSQEEKEKLWIQIIPDPPLRYLTKKCLEVDPKKRISVSEAAALTFIFGRTQGFRQKVFEELISKVEEVVSECCGDGENEKKKKEEGNNEDTKCPSKEAIEAGLKWKNDQIENLPSWARYTECPFAMPNFVSSTSEQEENSKKKKQQEEGIENEKDNNQDKNHSSSSTNSKKDEFVSLSDVVATSPISNLLNEETITKETKLLSSLPFCCDGCVENVAKSNNNIVVSPPLSLTNTPSNSPASSLNVLSASYSSLPQNNQNQQPSPPSAFPSSSSTNSLPPANATSSLTNVNSFEDINISRHQRRVSMLLDLELRSQQTKRLDHPHGILSIEKQMREVMRNRIVPATKSLKMIVNEIASLRKQEKNLKQQKEGK